MATKLDATSPGNQHTSVLPGHRGPGRRVIILIVVFAVFTTVHFLLNTFLSVEMTTPVPRYKLHRNVTVRVSQPAVTPRNPVIAPVSVSPHPTWTFNDEALQEIRKSAARLHPDVFLNKSTIMVNWKEKPSLTCNVTAKTRNNKTYPSQHNIGHYRTCAVVGNGGILLGSQCGPLIDSKDYVIRIDLPAVKGFERDVGRRTNMTVLNMSTPKRLEKSLQMKNRSQDVYESRLQNINGTVIVADRLSVGKLTRAFRKYRQSFVLFISSERLKRGSGIRGIRNVMSGVSGKRSLGSPSTGLLTVLMASTFCDQLYLYGFFPFQRDKKKRPVPYHYYPGDYVQPILQAGKHHMSNEYNLYRQLQKRGVLKLHVGKCGK
ncbi:ST8SIA2 [Branchiostoma lanceolatum]|uniref:ST8SIA2 protein n=1 Tax=Branchiostoma lanceolatum TaxID=7740 RepID=A0A8K0AC71_BRALA|nr:ST8SIA2 [Branchiostoma lanceolatum]